jgi:hypothetical protein
MNSGLAWTFLEEVAQFLPADLTDLIAQKFSSMGSRITMTA